MSDVEQFYRLDGTRLIRILRRRGCTREDAQDALHEAIVKLLSLGASCVPGLVYRTGVNCLLDQRKHRQVEQRLNPLVVLDEFDPSPEHSVVQQQLESRLPRAIAQLAIKHLAWSQAFHLRCQEGLPWPDIATRLGVCERMAQKYVAWAVEYCQQHIHTKR